MNNRLDTFEKTIETRFETLEKTVEARFDAVDSQFEAIREGIVYNSARFDRMEAKVFDARSDISNFRADIKELTEQIRQKNKESLIFEK